MRLDIPLTNSCTVVLLHEPEKGYAIRVLRRGEPNTFITPKISATFGDLMCLAAGGYQPLTFGNVAIHYTGVTVAVMVDGELVGWGGKGHLAAEVRAFLTRVDAIAFIRADKSMERRRPL